MTRLSLLVVAVLGACLVLAGTAHADTPTPTPETPPAVETAVAPAPVETATAPVAETPSADEETPPAEETPRPVEPEPPLTPAPDGEDLIIAPGPGEPEGTPGTEELIVAPPTTGAGSPSGSSWPWWPLAVAGAAAAGTAGLLLVAYQGRRARP